MTTSSKCEASFKVLLKSEGLLTRKQLTRLSELGITDMKAFAMSCEFLDQTPEINTFNKQIDEINEEPQNQQEDWDSDTQYAESDNGPPAAIVRSFRDLWWECSQTAKKESNQKHADKEEDTVVKLNDSSSEPP